MSQVKPTEYATVKTQDLRLIIESNERGKKAIEQVPVLMQKIGVLDSANRLHVYRLASHDSTIMQQAQQLNLLGQAYNNQAQIIANTKVMSDTFEKAYIRTKRSRNFFRITTILAGLATGYFAVFK